MNIKPWLARHAQTCVGSLGRASQQPLAASLTMAVIAIALALPALLAVVLQNASMLTANWNQTFDLSVYMDRRGSAAVSQAVARQLRARPEVAAVRVITADEALAEFRVFSGFGAALDALPDNPLPDTLVVTPALGASTPDTISELKTSISAMPGVQAVQVDSDWVKRLSAMLLLLKRAVWLSGSLLGLGVVLVVGNTIRLDILNRRAEIEVMKLIGASDGFARRPFLYSGLWYGLGGGVLSLGLIEAAVLLLTGPVRQVTKLYGSSYRIEGLGWRAGLTLLVLSGAFSWTGSWLIATRQIRSIEPS